MARRRRYSTVADPNAGPLTEADKAPMAFDSWGQFLEACAAPSELPDASRASRRDYGRYFSGTDNYAEAADLAVNGWPEGTEKAAALAHKLIDKIASQLQRDEYRYETTGITFDIARVLENEPEAWIVSEQVETKARGKVLRLVFNAAVSAAVDADIITAKGAVVAALVSLLERSGFRVQVDLTFVLRGSYSFETWVSLKRADQDMDLSRFVFAVAHPASLRRLYFSLAETRNASVRSAHNVPGGGYGYPVECPTDKRGDVYIGASSSLDSQWTDEASATAWILNQLKAQGIEVNNAE